MKKNIFRVRKRRVQDITEKKIPRKAAALSGEYNVDL